MTGREDAINPDNIVQAKRCIVGRCLDVGAGEVDELGDVTLDVDPDADPDVVADVTDGLPFDDGSFDTVAALHVLEHVPNDRELWREMCRVADRRAFAIVPMGERDDPDHERVYRTVGELEGRFDVDHYSKSSLGPYIDICFYVDF